MKMRPLACLAGRRQPLQPVQQSATQQSAAGSATDCEPAAGPRRRGVNDTDEDARRLLELTRNIRCKINL